MTQKTTTQDLIAPKLLLKPHEIKKNISRLQNRIEQLESFDYKTLTEGESPQLTTLIAAVKDTLERCFGENTSIYRRFIEATYLEHSHSVSDIYSPPDYTNSVRKNISTSIHLLQEAQRTLQEDLSDHQENEEASIVTKPDDKKLSRRVFVVHGHEQGSRESVARFLERIGFEAIILHEQANQGRTVIEKVEAHGNVGFAVVLLTPDDEGCAKGKTPEPRARQNVLLELGYFIGRLGRSKVSALKSGSIEIPSDFAGVVWEEMDNAGAWRQALARELQAAGHEVDWNKVMK